MAVMGVAQIPGGVDGVQQLGRTQMHRMGASEGLVDRIIGGGFALVLGIILLGFLFQMDLVNNSSGPFGSQLNTLENVIGAAITFGALGILALAAFYARSMVSGR